LVSWQRRHPGLCAVAFWLLSVSSVHETSEVSGWVYWFVVAQSLALIMMTGHWARSAWSHWLERR
jgi:hypothetical protein